MNYSWEWQIEWTQKIIRLRNSLPSQYENYEYRIGDILPKWWIVIIAEIIIFLKQSKPIFLEKMIWDERRLIGIINQFRQVWVKKMNKWIWNFSHGSIVHGDLYYSRHVDWRWSINSDVVIFLCKLDLFIELVENVRG